jgi:hypothetical protein
MTCNQNCRQGRECNCKGWHVYPVDDLREHELNGSCWCRPTLDDEGSEPIWIHNSLDGREAFETGERLPS